MKDFRDGCDYIFVREKSTNQINDESQLLPFMKPTRAFTSLPVIALIANALALHAQTWQVLAPRPDFAPTGPCGSILLDPFPPGGIMLGVRGSPSPADNVVLWVGADGSSTGVLDSGAFNDLRQLAYVPNDGSPNGTLYAVGQSLGSRFNTWKVRKSLDTGLTWADDGGVFYLGKGNTSLAQGLASDANGIAYACGYAYGSAGNDRHWIVRRKLSSSADWTTVSDLSNRSPGNDAMAIHAYSGTTTLAPAVFAVGSLNGKWTVMRSRDQGNTWQQAGAKWWPTGQTYGAVTDVACDNAGRIYAAGYYGLTAVGCAVQVSTDGGDSWTTLLSDNSSTPTGKWRLAIDTSGYVTLTGKISDSTLSDTRWIVVRPANPTERASWAASYLTPLQPFPNAQSWGGVAAADATGALFLGGSVANWNGYTGMGLVRMTP